MKDQGLAQNTIILYTSDNGPWSQFDYFGGRADPLRGYKATSYEGGLRVPCVVWGPSLVKPGRTEDQIIRSIDILPTIAGIVGKELETNGLIDGVDQKNR